jgi:cation diffusion facilitator family transporter
LVVAITAFMMVAEIAAGLAFGSMALLADGWHMGTHVAALGITLFAYSYARRHATDPRYSFGTGKVGVLGGFASAVVLGVVALLMAVESIDRILNPVAIRFNEAIMVAVLGLVVNLVSAWLLKDDHHHHHHHGHEGTDHQEHTHGNGHRHGHAHSDHNLRAAYLHVLADALTSLLAIGALIAGKFFGWIWADAFMGVAGALVITRWAWGLLTDTSRILLDRQPDRHVSERVRQVLESEEDVRVADLHYWPVGANHGAVIVSLVTHHPRQAAHYKQLLEDKEAINGVDHLTIEVNTCEGDACVPPSQINSGSSSRELQAPAHVH